MPDITLERALGWRLARPVVESPLYEQLGDLERAERDELLRRGNSSILRMSETPPAGVSCRLAVCIYKADCDQLHHCQAAVLKTQTYRHFLDIDLRSTLERISALTQAEGDLPHIANELVALGLRARRIV